MTAPMLPFLTRKNGLIFRVTHMDNLPWILDHGLHCASSDVRDPGFVEIGLRDLIERRARQPVQAPPGGALCDYIPFYFTPRSVMLFNIVTGHRVPLVVPERLVILVTSVGTLAANGLRFLLTDRHASLAYVRFADDASGLDRVDWRILQASDFQRGEEDPEKIDRYQAEALVHRHVPPAAIERLVCYGPEQAKRVGQELAGRGLAHTVEVQKGWFFG